MVFDYSNIELGDMRCGCVEVIIYRVRREERKNILLYLSWCEVFNICVFCE